MILFAERLKQLRTEKNLKQSELAQVLSVDQRTISNWESEKNEPPLETIIKIAKFFEVSTDFLLGLSEE